MTPIFAFWLGSSLGFLIGLVTYALLDRSAAERHEREPEDGRRTGNTMKRDAT